MVHADGGTGVERDYGPTRDSPSHSPAICPVAVMSINVSLLTSRFRDWRDRETHGIGSCPGEGFFDTQARTEDLTSARTNPAAGLDSWERCRGRLLKSKKIGSNLPLTDGRITTAAEVTRPRIPNPAADSRWPVEVNDDDTSRQYGLRDDE